VQSRLSTVFISSILFLFFIFFSFLVHENVFTQFDFDMTVKLQDRIPRRFDGLFSWFSVIGDFQYLLIVLIVMFVLIRKYVAGVIAFGLFGVFHLIELYGKFYVEHLPPPEFMLRTDRPIDFHPFYVRSEFSYPSGHSGRTMFLSGVLIVVLFSSKKIPPVVRYGLIAGIIVFDTIMLLSRIYLGEHWATDVIGGAILGLSFGVFSGLVATLTIPWKKFLKKLFSLSDRRTEASG
jgi:undecaprenyl-diphosphatase